jgi:hypothetical protein
MSNCIEWDITSVGELLNCVEALFLSLFSSFVGVRLIDDFLAKSGVDNCSNFRETADVISKVAFKMFLGITPEVVNWNKENTAFSLVFVDNPLVDFVELPPQYMELSYCNLLCGIIVGALEMVQLQVGCTFVKDVLRGDDGTELRVELKGLMRNVMSDEYKEK